MIVRLESDSSTIPYWPFNFDILDIKWSLVPLVKDIQVRKTLVCNANFSLLLNGIINKGKKTAIRNISGMKTQQLFQSKQQQATTSSLFNKPYCVKGNYCNSTFNTVIIVFNKDGEQKVARWSVRTCTIVFLAWMKNFFIFSWLQQYQTLLFRSEVRIALKMLLSMLFLMKPIKLFWKYFSSKLLKIVMRNLRGTWWDLHGKQYMKHHIQLLKLVQSHLQLTNILDIHWNWSNSIVNGVSEKWIYPVLNFYNILWLLIGFTVGTVPSNYLRGWKFPLLCKCFIQKLWFETKISWYNIKCE